jgi:hypothetical protein
MVRRRRNLKKGSTMETKDGRSARYRGIVIVAAVVLALFGITTSLATKEQPQAASAAAPAAASAHEDPSLSGLSVGSDAEEDGNVEMFN